MSDVGALGTEIFTKKTPSGFCYKDKIKKTYIGKREGAWGDKVGGGGGVVIRDDLDLFWALSWSLKLTSLQARLAAIFHNMFLFTVETGWNSPQHSEIIRTYCTGSRGVSWSPERLLLFKSFFFLVKLHISVTT